MAKSGVDIKDLTNFKKKFKSLKKTLESAINKSVRDVTKQAMSELWENTPVDTGQLRNSYFISGNYTIQVNKQKESIPLKQVAVYDKEYWLEIVNLAIGTTLHAGEFYQYYVNKGDSMTNYSGHHHVDNMIVNASINLPLVLDQNVKQAILKWNSR